ncbi:nuclear transport factor 2 family protein [Sorangium sp. So ce327]|uniref:nuclear transport factor 2 family protein n=1 Tax=Sorangium sp. So ce327 TaxID=3133301 RepID=UPI003F5D77D8
MSIAQLQGVGLLFLLVGFLVSWVPGFERAPGRLALVGVVWCYVFVTATTLVARSRPGSERFRAQRVARRASPPGCCMLGRDQARIGTGAAERMESSERKPASPEDSVRQMLVEFARAFERGDVDALCDMFVRDDALIFYGTHDKLHFTRWAEIEASFRRQSEILKDLVCRITGDVQVRLLAGGAAACAGTAGFGIHATMGGVRFDLPALRLTCTVERHGDHWRFVQLHLSVSDRPFLDSVGHVLESA